MRSISIRPSRRRSFHRIRSGPGPIALRTSPIGQRHTGQNSSPHPVPAPNVPVDANGNPIPLERRSRQRILGFMPNFRSVSGGAKPHPPGWKYNFSVATHQATDYSSFIFLGLTSFMRGRHQRTSGSGQRRGAASTLTRGADSSIRPTIRISRRGCCPRSSTKTRAFTRSARATTIFVRETVCHQPPGGCQDLRRPSDAEYRRARRQGAHAGRLAELLPEKRHQHFPSWPKSSATRRCAT